MSPFRNVTLYGAITVLILSGCMATPIQGGKNPNQIFIESTPTKATVLLNDEVIGITPLYVKLPRKENPQYITISKDGYKPEEITFLPIVYGVSDQKRNMVTNSTLFFGGAGLVFGLVVSAPLSGLLGGSILGFVAGAAQEEKNITTIYEHSPRNVKVNLSPLWK
ncbi:MAG: PEGA domain-containing protein [Planctomycetota bacterium]|nr:PEGA domain-containing protein [Planctomycetota bacterium]